MRFNILVVLFLAVIVLGISMSAQTPVDPGPVVIGGMAGTPPLPPKPGLVTMRMEHADAMDVVPTKGAPFCATITTEHTQPFADGNRIHTTDSSSICRDSEGRIRRDSDLNLLGAAPQKPAAKLVTVVDPVAGYRYILNSDSKVAHRMVLPSSVAATASGSTGPQTTVPGKEQRVMIFRSTGEAGPRVNVFYKRAGPAPDEPAPTTESLGDQTIEGIHATGTRVTTTIPAGEMGNEQPIIVTSERWYSPELKATVMTRHNDPWAGELKTQFTNVNSSEPDRSLFAVPSDYKIIDDKEGPLVMQLPSPPPAPH